MEINKLIDLLIDMDKTHENEVEIHTPVKEKMSEPGMPYRQHEHNGECIIQINFTPKNK